MEAQSIKLLHINKNKIQFTPEGLHKLKTVQGHIFPICVVGPVLTGKSTIMNQIIGAEKFETNNTTMPKTRGVYAYFEQIKGHHNPAQHYMFMDVQGFDNSFSDEGEQDCDLQLMALMMCCCRVIIYNNYGALDSCTIERLANVCKGFTERLMYTPHLILLQRDFALKLESSRQQSLTNEEYLEFCFKNFKDRSSINSLHSAFVSSNLSEHNISCAIFPAPEQSKKYNESLKMLRKLINQQVHKYKQQQILSTSVNLICIIESFISEHTNTSVKDIYLRAQKMKETEAKSCLITYKSLLLEITKSDIKQHLPIPQQLLYFKFERSKKKCIESICHVKEHQAHYIQLMDKNKMQQMNKKIITKLQQQNSERIHQFIQAKVTQQIEGFSEIIEQENKLKQIMSSFTFYPFVQSVHNDWIELQFYKQWSCKLVTQIMQAKSQIEQASKQKILQLKHFKQSDQLKEADIRQFTAQVNILQTELQQCRKQLNSAKQKVKQLNSKRQQDKEFIQESQNSIKKYTQIVQNLSQSEKFKLLEIQRGLTTNILYQQKQSKHQCSHFDELIMNSINRVVNLVQNKEQHQKRNSKQHYEQVVLLQNINKSLRVRIDELMISGNSSDFIEAKYKQERKIWQQKQKNMQNMMIQRQKQLSQLQDQLRRNNKINSSLQMQIDLYKTKDFDKNKTTQFIQKLLQAKQRSLQQTQQELFQISRKYKQEINTIQAKHLQLQTELSSAIGTLSVQKQQLSVKVSELSQRLIGIQSKLRRQMQDKLQEKQSKLKQLNQQLESSEKSLQESTESYLQVTHSMQAIIDQKDSCISQLQQQVRTTQIMVKQTQEKFDRVKCELKEQSSRVHRLELQKQDVENKLKRQQSLFKNRVQHAEIIQDKLKSELRQKESTFDLMLLQLRSQNILNNNRSQTINTLKKEKKQQFNKKIDEIERITLKQLEAINKNYTDNGKNHKFTKVVSLSAVKLPEKYKDLENKPEIYFTDKKPRTNLINMDRVVNNDNPLANLSNMDSNGFKTITKRI